MKRTTYRRLCYRCNDVVRAKVRKDRLGRALVCPHCGDILGNHI